MFTKRNYVFELLTGIANRLNTQRKTQAWGIVVYENGEFREE
jgi:hypothetical protein